jgi:hypothetical protein
VWSERHLRGALVDRGLDKDEDRCAAGSGESCLQGHRGHAIEIVGPFRRMRARRGDRDVAEVFDARIVYATSKL